MTASATHCGFWHNGTDASVEAEVRDILLRQAKSEQRINWDEAVTVASGNTGSVTRDLINSTYDEPGA